jgi:Uma2 family endonuclease
MAIQVEPRTNIKRHLVTLDEYDRMVESAVFEPEARIELIRGEIGDMPPPGSEQESTVARLDRLFNTLVRDAALVWPQGNSIGLPRSNSRPQPDVTILRWRGDYYAGKRPLPEDVILLVEVADSTLRFERGSKLQLYAESGIQEYWVVNLVNAVVEVYADPSAGKYQVARRARRGETLQLPGVLGGELAAGDILGRESKS